MRSDYRIRASRFLNEIAPMLVECFDNECSYNTEVNVSRAINWYNHHMHRAIKVYHGATRIALVTSDYVIKFDYNPHNVADFGGCEDEVKMYRYAKQHGYGRLFAPITRVTVENHNFYIMPRVRYIGSMQNLIGWTDEEIDWVYDYVFDIHEYNFGKIDGHAVLIDYAANTLGH